MMSKAKAAAKSWITKTDVDYYMYFLATWITFNAWFGNRYRHTTEREKIDKIKNDVNDDFHKAINGILESSDQINELFLQHIGNLHRALENEQLSTSKGRKILFDTIEEIDNPNTEVKTVKRSIKYHFRFIGECIKVDITDSRGASLLDYGIEKKCYNTTDFKEYVVRSRLSDTQKKIAVSIFEQLAPKVNLEVIETRKRPRNGEFYQAPDFKFKRDSNKINDEGHLVICCLVEILYQLRNLLVHGELEPSAEKHKIYQHAYLIMQMLLPSITK